MNRPEALYLAHPVVGDATGLSPEQIAERVKENLARASRWLAWLVYNIDDVAIRCSWLGYIMSLPETPEMRERGLRDDDSEAATCTGIVLCGGYLSSGMRRGVKTLLDTGEQVTRTSADVRRELAKLTEAIPENWPNFQSRYVLDLLDFGSEPPEWSPAMSRDVLRRRLEIARTTGSNGPTTEMCW